MTLVVDRGILCEIVVDFVLSSPAEKQVSTHRGQAKDRPA